MPLKSLHSHEHTGIHEYARVYVHLFITQIWIWTNAGHTFKSIWCVSIQYLCYTRFPGTPWDTPTCTENKLMSKAHDSNEVPNDGVANGNWGITFCNVIMIHVIKRSRVKYVDHLGKVSSLYLETPDWGIESPSLNVNDNIADCLQRITAYHTFFIKIS